MILNTVGGGGGGAGLNFSVKAYASESALPSVENENTIAVITEAEITSWIFSITEPESPEEGMVWIVTDRSSTVEFNALKKNGIQVYPISAKQYVSGAWVEKTTKTYQNGEWVEWWNGAIYVDGVFGVAFNARAVGNGQFANVAAPTVTDHGTYVTIKPTNTGAQNDGIWQSDKIRIAKQHTALQIKFAGGNQLNSWAWYGISQIEPVTGNLNAVVQNIRDASSVTEALNVTNLDGDYYLWFHVGQQNGNSYVYYDISEIRLI